jgi:tRNA-splicing ligase RtcB (3'-phosphate/5'-hydroxy nucleic acid ligase)
VQFGPTLPHPRLLWLIAWRAQNSTLCGRRPPWGYGVPIGGVAAFDPKEGGVVSAGGVGFDISCGVRTMTTGLTVADMLPVQKPLADSLFRQIPAGVGSKGAISLDAAEMNGMLSGGARWAVERGWGEPRDPDRIEESWQMAGAQPACVSQHA